MKRTLKKFFSKLIIPAMILMAHVSLAQTIADGIKAMENENYITARSIMLAYTKANPGDVLGFYQLGNVYCFLEKNDSAKIAYTMGTTLNPKHPACFAGLGKVFLNENNNGEALKNFDIAKSLVNQNKDINLAVYLADAYVYSSNPNPELALQILKGAENISNKDSRIYMLMGDANVILNKGGESVSAYEFCSQLAPANARPQARIGMIWNLAHNYKESKSAFEKAIAIDSKFAPAYRDFAELYFNTGQYELAKETFQKYLDLADKTDETQYRYAEFLFLTKDYAKGMEVLAKLRSSNPNKLNLLRLLAYCYYETGNYADGLSTMKEFMSKNPEDKNFAIDYQYYGKLLIKTGNDSLAEKIVLKAVKMDSSQIDILGDLAQSFYTKKIYGKAAAFYEMKAKKNPNPNFQDYFNAGRSYYFDSAYAIADSMWKKVTELVPQWPIGYWWRARCNLLQDNMDSLKGFAEPFYLLTIEKAIADSLPSSTTHQKKDYAKELKESYRFLGDLNTVREKYEDALMYYQKYLELNPADADEVNKTIESIKNAMKGGKQKSN